MPPKARFTGEEIIDAALGIVRSRGADALTARELGAALKSSARPIFTVFHGMEEVRSRVLRAAKDVYNGYVRQGLACEKKFKGVGTAYIRFARSEPKLFQLLFMRERDGAPPASQALLGLEENYGQILRSVEQDYGVRGDRAVRLYRHLWIYAHGIAALCATGVCSFDDREIDGLLTEVCQSLLACGSGPGADTGVRSG